MMSDETRGRSEPVTARRAKPVPAYICRDLTLCVPTHSPMDFEGRPANGAALNPGHTHDWELKYGFSPFGGVQYAANLWYQISGTNGTVEIHDRDVEHVKRIRLPRQRNGTLHLHRRRD